MSTSRDLPLFERGLAAALARPEVESLGALLHAPTVTAIVADPRDGTRLAPALGVLLGALTRVGVPRGRCFVLLASPSGKAADGEAVRRLREAIGVPVIAHDPARSACFRADGAIELNDELREAEAIVALSSWREASRDEPGTAGLIVPGLASRACRDAVCGTTPDFGLVWIDDPGVFHAWSGPWAAVCEAARRSVMDLPRGTG